MQVPHEALEIAEMLINFRSGKFGYSICPIFSKGHTEIFREFWHDFCYTIGHMEYPKSAEMEVNRHSGKFGLMRYLSI